MRVIEANDVLSAVAAFALDANQFLRVDIVAVVSGIGASVAATGRIGDNARAVVFETAEQNSTAFVRIRLFAMLADCFVIVTGEFEHCNC